MGNCQTVDAAALEIQHPCGKIERLYWSVTASEIMRTNPGHYVSLIIPLPVPEEEQHNHQEHNQDHKTVLFTRVKLLRPNETLTLGHAYRLITTQEVLKVIRAKKHARTRKPQAKTGGKLDAGMTYQAIKAERHGLRAASANSAALRPKLWRPSLQSILESSTRPNIIDR